MFPVILDSEKLTIEYVESVTLPGTKQVTSEYLQAWGGLPEGYPGRGKQQLRFQAPQDFSVIEQQTNPPGMSIVNPV